VLAGNLDVESYERAVTAAAASVQEYEASKTIISFSAADVQIGNRSNESAIIQPGSKSEKSSSVVGDVMFASVLAPLLCLFAFSLTPDPLAQGSRAAFDSNCDQCVQLEIQPKAQYDVESMAGVERFLKYTSEPSERFYRPTDQEITGCEIFNGRTVDVQSMLIMSK